MKAYAKGREFEYLIAKQLREAGFDAKRMPRSGAIDGLDSDLFTPELPIVWELKKQETWKVGEYMKQAIDSSESTGKMPVVVMGRNNLKDPYVVLNLSNFIWLLQLAKETGNFTRQIGYSKRKQTK